MAEAKERGEGVEEGVGGALTLSLLLVKDNGVPPLAERIGLVGGETAVNCGDGGATMGLTTGEVGEMNVGVAGGVTRSCTAEGLGREEEVLNVLVLEDGMVMLRML